MSLQIMLLFPLYLITHVMLYRSVVGLEPTTPGFVNYRLSRPSHCANISFVSQGITNGQANRDDIGYTS